MREISDTLNRVSRIDYFENNDLYQTTPNYFPVTVMFEYKEDTIIELLFNSEGEELTSYNEGRPFRITHIIRDNLITKSICDYHFSSENQKEEYFKYNPESNIPYPFIMNYPESHFKANGKFPISIEFKLDTYDGLKGIVRAEITELLQK